MTTSDERRGAVEAIERIVNVGESVVPRTLEVVRRLYPAARIESGRILVEDAEDDDVVFLRRVSTLVSAHLSSAENA